MSHFDSKSFSKYTEYSFKGRIDTPKKKLHSDSRELQMIPTYLELAKNNGQYRFNKEEIEEISKAFKFYATNLSLIDLLKELLAIGSETNNTLSAKEIKGFLTATTEMKMIEQKNVLRFLNAAKTKEGIKITPEYLMETYPYEKFKAREINFSKKYNLNPKSIPFSDENELKAKYKSAIQNQILTLSNEGYRKILSTNKCPVSEYITKNNKPAVETIAKCTNPELFFSIVDATGLTPSVLATANSLITLYSISGKNEALIVDLSRAFYPAEIKQITEILSQKAKSSDHKILPELLDYVSNTYKVYDSVSSSSSIPKLDIQRKNILEDLGLKEQIKLEQLSKYEKNKFC